MVNRTLVLQVALRFEFQSLFRLENVLKKLNLLPLFALLALFVISAYAKPLSEQGVKLALLPNGRRGAIIRNPLTPVATVKANFIVDGYKAPWDFAGTAHAQDASGVDVRVQSFHADVHVQPSGAYTDRQTQVIQVLTRTGAQSLNPFQEEYSKSMARLKVESAYIVKPDGQRIDIAAADIVERPAPAPPGSDNSPIYDNNMMLTVTLPGFSKGDTLHLQTLKTQTKAYFPNQFFDEWGPDETESARNQSIVVYAPVSMKLRAAQRGGWTIMHRTEGDSEVFTATLAEHHAEFPGTSTVNSSDYSPIFEVTSFPTWASVGAAYWARAQVKAAVTPLVKKVADQVAGKLHGWDAVKALYTWESEHIHYIGLELGVGGYVPISANTTLKTGYGDCKQHSTLLEALLAARGIRVDPVLINWNNSFNLGPLPGLDFNHAIDYVPKYHVFLDTTGEFETPGQLAIGERDKEVVIAGPNPRLARTPGAEPEDNKLVYEATLHLATDGTLSGSVNMTGHGWWAWFYRMIFSQVPPAAYGRLMNMLLTPSGGGSGSFQPGNPAQLDRPMQVTAHWSTPAYALPGKTLSVPLPAGPYLVPNMSGTDDPVAALTAVVGPESRRHSVSTYFGEVDWQSTLELPAGYVPTYLPPDTNLSNGAGSFTYTVKDVGGMVNASYRLKLDRVVYTPAQYSALRALMLSCLRAQSAPLVFHPIQRNRHEAQ